jgi:hypothetical protein
MLAAVAALATLAALTAWMPMPLGSSRPLVAAPPTASYASAGPPPRALPRSTPVRLAIPAIDAESSLMSLQLNPDRTVQVPPLSNPMQAGWYSLGPTPGEAGASVILGHVDGRREPGIFFRLNELRSGDRVLVARQDGTTAWFVVYRTEQAPKDDFPTKDVYAATARPELRLVTCGGSFDRESGNYRDNVIAFAVLAGSS